MTKYTKFWGSKTPHFPLISKKCWKFLSCNCHYDYLLFNGSFQKYRSKNMVTLKSQTQLIVLIWTPAIGIAFSCDSYAMIILTTNIFNYCIPKINHFNWCKCLLIQNIWRILLRHKLFEFLFFMWILTKHSFMIRSTGI